MTSTQENSELIKLKKLYHKTTKIFGPPGTGKTYTLIERVLKNYLRKGVQPSDIAYLSFTNKAVNTAVKRAMESFPNYSTEDFLRFKTLHTYCRVKVLYTNCASIVYTLHTQCKGIVHTLYKCSSQIAYM